MDKVTMNLIVFFEDPFWVGVFERVSDGELSVSKVTYGAEPKDYEIHMSIVEKYDQLKFSPAVNTTVTNKKRINPKRAIREAKKQVIDVGIGTKSQQALKLQQEQNKLERKIHSKERKEAEMKRQFELKQQKRREKHKGR